jgi:hypothetical protein
MESIEFCQSCSMPLTDPELLGTESDGSPATEYCKYCYSQGQLINPGMSMEDMKSLIIEKMEKQHIPEDIIEAAVLRLPLLKRWKNKQKTLI